MHERHEAPDTWCIASRPAARCCATPRMGRGSPDFHTSGNNLVLLLSPFEGLRLGRSSPRLLAKRGCSSPNAFLAG